MEPRIQYAKTSDGVSIAYASIGEGPPLVVMPALWEQFSLTWEMEEWRDFLARLGRGRRLVQYDRRGFGLSERDVDEFSVEHAVTDLEAVFQALQLRSAALFASTLAGPAAISYAVEYPRNVSHLILFGTFSRGSDVRSQTESDALATLSRTDWHAASQLFADTSTRDEYAEAGLAFARHWRESATGEAAARLLALEPDVRALLPKVKAPALILHRRGDAAIPMSAGQAIAAGIPNAQFIPLEGEVHAYMLGRTEPILAAIDEFLNAEVPSQRVVESAQPSSDVLTILFTDMEGSTTLADRLGDDAAQDVRRAHNEIVRAALSANAGTEIKHTGDGIMASFATASSALDSAIAIQRGVAAHKQANPESPLAVYVGLNAGEPIAEGDPEGRIDLFGTSVNLAARICDHAEAGQILAANVVRELAAGKQFLFSDLGETELRGFEDPIKLWELRWEEQD
ncbi:MAG: adenylate/guanylate cyclase domain-containing protein [Chloroflexi bacterium]|nr:adenylate/guanylate cyclase domain-containing protein [Chloroflexota bacterium]